MSQLSYLHETSTSSMADQGDVQVCTFSLSKLFILAWLVPCLLVLTGIAKFLYIALYEIGAVIVPAALAWWLMRRGGRVRPPLESIVQIKMPPLRRMFFFAASLSMAGSYLVRLAYAHAGVDLSDVSVQQMYVEVLNLQQEGELSTGLLGGIGQLLRTAHPFMLVSAVLLLYAEQGIGRRLYILAFASSTTYLSYVSSFSRGSLLFYVVCIVLSAWCLPIRRRSFLSMAGIVFVVGIIFFNYSAGERIAAIGIDDQSQLEALELLFECSPTFLSRLLIRLGGPQLWGLVLYFVHSIAEGAHLVLSEHSPLLLGSFTFFPFVNPVKRLLGYSSEWDLSGLDHPNAWYSAVGEMYLDFGLVALIMFPVLAFVMFRVAMANRRTGLFGIVHFIVTGVFFALFPLYSVFHSFGLIYLASLSLSVFAALTGKNKDTKRAAEIVIASRT